MRVWTDLKKSPRDGTLKTFRDYVALIIPSSTELSECLVKKNSFQVQHFLNFNKFLFLPQFAHSDLAGNFITRVLSSVREYPGSKLNIIISIFKFVKIFLNRDTTSLR